MTYNKNFILECELHRLVVGSCQKVKKVNHMKKIVGNIICLIIFFFAGLISADSGRVDYRLDNEVFRRGLIDRGFDDWLKVYDVEHPAATDIDLLAEQIGRAWLNYRRETNHKIREKKLETLLELELDRVESYSDHPLSANWRVRYAGDLLNEKIGPIAFVHLIHLSLPKDLHDEMQSGLDRIDSQLSMAKKFLQTQLAGFQKLDDKSLAAVNRQGLPELYQSSLYQADYLRAWSMYHRIWMFPESDPNRVKILYELSDLLQALKNDQTDIGTGSLKLLQADVELLLGKNARALEMLEQAMRNLPGYYMFYAYIEQANIALANDQPRIAMQAVEKAQSLDLFQNDPERKELGELSLAMIEGRAKLAMLSEGDQCRRQNRNEAWASLTEVVTARPSLMVFVFPLILKNSESVSPGSMADVELFAHADNALAMNKTLLAQSDFRELISRKSVNKAIRKGAAIRLAMTLEKEGHFAMAVKTLSEADVCDSAEVAAEKARLAWLAYQADHTDASRKIFIESSSVLLDRFPHSDSSDQFRLLMAEDYSEQGSFAQSLQLIGQVPAGSARYMQAQAARVLVLSRQYKSQASGVRKQASPAEQILADQVEKACKDLLVVASANQKQPEKIETWSLSPDQVKLLAGAILAGADVLSDPLLDGGERARKLLEVNRPILNKYQDASKSTLAVQITMLVQTASTAGRIEAVNMTLKMLEEKQLPLSQMAETTIFVLETVHQAVLETAGVFSDVPNDLAMANLNLAKRAMRYFLNEKSLSKALSDRLLMFYIIAATDAGEYSLAKESFDKYKPEPGDVLVDLTLARMKMDYALKQYAASATGTMELLQKISPGDIRYWHALVINLRSHLALGSDRDQIVAAILARRREYPNLGSTFTREELEKILHLIETKQ